MRWVEFPERQEHRALDDRGRFWIVDVTRTPSRVIYFWYELLGGDAEEQGAQASSLEEAKAAAEQAAGRSR